MAFTTAKFRVDPLLIKVLSETYRSTEKALKELVDNAWDADAGTVRISLPAPMSGDSIVIADDGSGMTATEVEGEYLIVADDRRSRRGDRTPNRKRQVKGRKGIGKFAGLMAADTMSMETVARGQRTHLRIRKEALKPREGDLEAVSLPKEVSACPPDEHGTTITLSDLNQAFDYPDAANCAASSFLNMAAARTSPSSSMAVVWTWATFQARRSSIARRCPKSERWNYATQLATANRGLRVAVSLFGFRARSSVNQRFLA